VAQRQLHHSYTVANTGSSPVARTNFMNNVDALNHYRIWEINKNTQIEEFYINLAAIDDEEANKRLEEFRAIPLNKDVSLWMEKLNGGSSHRKEEFE